MPPQTPIDVFKLEVQEAFEQYLNTSYKPGKLLMNAARRAIYRRFFSDPDQKITKLDKHEKFRFYTEKHRAINRFCIDNGGQLLHFGLRKRDITRQQAFVYDAFDIIASEITYYISLYVSYFWVPRIFQCDNGREFKGALLIFLKKHGIKLINGRPRTPCTQGLVEQANAVVKNKITRWNAEHDTRVCVESLTEICEAINSQTHES